MNLFYAPQRSAYNCEHVKHYYYIMKPINYLHYYRSHPIPAYVQVLCSLGLLATGNFQTTNADRSGISQPSLSRVLPHVLDGIIRLAPTHIRLP